VAQLRPECEIFGVEPTGADSMYRSFLASAPVRLDTVQTIADSLGAPYALPYSYSLCKASVKEIVLVTDEQLQRAMGSLFRALRIAVEPACAASTAALLGPLADRLSGRRVVLILCGSNIDWTTYARQAELRLPNAA
jgi:threonine dehydratase